MRSTTHPRMSRARSSPTRTLRPSPTVSRSQRRHEPTSTRNASAPTLQEPRLCDTRTRLNHHVLPPSRLPDTLLVCADKFAFNGEGAYSVLSKGASGDADPCSVDIQTFECPGAGVQSYMMAVAITATGGEKTHEIVLQGDGCTLDGAACGDAEGKNVGTDGVTLVPYTPGAKGQPAMGDFGPGVKGWYVYAGGFKVNVTKTVGPDGEAMMNLFAAAPPMCTSGASGLCTTTVSNADAKLQAFAAEYLTSKAKKDAPAKKRRGQQDQQELLAPDSVPELDTYPNLVPAKTISGLNGLSCPASQK